MVQVTTNISISSYFAAFQLSSFCINPFVSVQDAKSDRVKQLLKETEKYLQKLGSKLQDAKVVARRFEMEMDESRAINFVEKNEDADDNEDECDQAQVSCFCVLIQDGFYFHLTLSLCAAALSGKQ